MKAVAGGMKETKPVPLGGVAGTGETEKIAWTSAATQQPGQRGMNRPASVTIAPARHDEGTGEDTGPLPARPAHRFQKLIGAFGIPIDKKQFCLRGQGMHDFTAKNAVGTVLCFEIAVHAEGTDVDMSGQGTAQVGLVAAET